MCCGLSIELLDSFGLEFVIVFPYAVESVFCLESLLFCSRKDIAEDCCE